MSSLLHVEWTVLTAETPQITRPCRRCGSARAFQSTGKFRVNANGSRLDAWLIYRCVACGNRWNRALFERCGLRSIPKELLEALQDNDAGLARQVALGAGAATGNAIPGSADGFAIKKRLLSSADETGAFFSLTVLNPDSCSVRLDKVLAAGLNVSRRSVHELADAETLFVTDGSGKALKRPLKATATIGFTDLAHAHVPDLRNRLVKVDQVFG